ncbi:hypothetical protein K1719_018554 [Acacia pycnantha]|nr:hypothetical protein K1719_018554 [Acacia pycnantha]
MLSLSDKDLSNFQKDCQLKAENWSRERNFGDENAPQAVFNALDNMLKDSLERLQKMRLAYIKQILELRPSPNCATYNTFIKAYCLDNNLDKALYLFSTMVHGGIQPNRVTCNVLVHALCGKGLLKEAKMLFEKILNDEDGEGIPDLVTSTISMDHHFKNGASVQALGLWDEMLLKKGKVDVVAYNILIHGLYKIDEACSLLDVISKMGVRPNLLSYNINIEGLCLNGFAVRAKQLLQFMLDYITVPKPLIWNLLIDCYGRCGDLSNAFFMKKQMLALGVQPIVFIYL